VAEIFKKYFIIVGALANTLMCVLVTAVLIKVYSTGLSLPLFSDKITNNLKISQPNLYRVVSPILNLMSYFEVKNYYFKQVELTKWSGSGANHSIAYQGGLQDIYVSNTSEFIAALKSVKAGQTILLSPGEYRVKQSSIHVKHGGTESLPIKVTAIKLGTVKLFFQGEGLVVDKPYWQFNNLHIIGSCKRHEQCEHAFHVVGKGQNIVIENNILQDFNAMIKVNGFAGNYPDHGKVINNTIFNLTPRNTVNPVTPIDLMHANFWQVSDNFIFDIQKSAGDKVSYAAFFKGGSEQGVFERNLVICAANLPDDYTALGLSLGGGGSLRAHRRNQNSAEHVGGIIRHNIIMHCSNDVGIYVNRASKSLIEHNILYNTLGIDIRYEESDAKIVSNVISGRIKNRDNADLIQFDNLTVSRSFITGGDQLSDYFVAPDIGDFTWRSPPAESTRNKRLTTGASDFCNVNSTELYVGAFDGTTFCLDKLNLKINE
jgi:hypothetical protein